MDGLYPEWSSGNGRSRGHPAVPLGQESRTRPQATPDDPDDQGAEEPRGHVYRHSKNVSYLDVPLSTRTLLTFRQEARRVE